jgi:chromate transporter
MRGSVYYLGRRSLGGGGRLRELAAYFLRLGVVGFGGPAAHIALMERDCVAGRRWITRERFLDVLGAANLIPGPTSTELAMHIGYVRAGIPGLVVAGACFILPAAVMVGVLAAMYVGAGTLGSLDDVLRAVKPVVIVVVLFAVVSLATAALRGLRLALLAAAAAVLVVRGVNEVAVLLLAGAANAILTRGRPARLMSIVLLPELFAYFVKAGATVLGSGYVLFAILRADLVHGTRWITEAQLIDAIAVGQVTPGPVFTAATFIGYLVAGWAGAVVATVGVFLPAFIFSGLSARSLERIGRWPLARAALDGVNAAAVALIALVLIALVPHAIVDWRTLAIAVAAAAAIGLLRVNAAWVILAAAATGVAARLL